MAWIGIDDTDSPRGGCTTWVLSEVLRELLRTCPDIDLVGAPRLVRLNPNIPWKTRGNAALSARFGRGRGVPTRMGELGGAPLKGFARGLPLREDQVDRLWQVAVEVVARSSDRSEPGTDPTVVLSPSALPAELYWRAVREVVPWRAVLDRLADLPGVRLAAFGSGQGIVGASAAIAWPARRRTWEAVAYRPPSRWGTPREVDPVSVRRVDARYPETFLSFDPRTRRTLVAPHTPCPVLFGIRALRPGRLPRAISEVGTGSEVPERWVLFQSNQATGDHLCPRELSQGEPATSGVYEGTVGALPRALPGGRVEFSIIAGERSMPCVAFEPTKELPALARRLLAGDRVRVWGSRAYGDDDPRAGHPWPLRLEGIQVLHARPQWEKAENPRCAECGRRMGSLGSRKGFRCAICGRRSPPESARGSWRPRSTLKGTYLPTPSSRRHLAPLVAPRGARSS